MNLIDKLRQNFNDVDSSVSQLLDLHFSCTKTVQGHVARLQSKRIEIDKSVTSLRGGVEKTRESGAQFTANLGTHGEQQAKETRLCRDRHRQEMEAFREQSGKANKALERLTKLAQEVKAKADARQQQSLQGFAAAIGQMEQSGQQIRALGSKAVDQAHRQEEESSKIAGEVVEKGTSAHNSVTKLQQGATSQGQLSQKSLLNLGQAGQSEVQEKVKASSPKWKSSIQKEVADFRKELISKKNALLADLGTASTATQKWLESAPGEFEESVVNEVAKAVKEGRESASKISLASGTVANVCAKLEPMLPVLEALQQEIQSKTGKGRK